SALGSLDSVPARPSRERVGTSSFYLIYPLAPPTLELCAGSTGRTTPLSGTRSAGPPDACHVGYGRRPQASAQSFLICRGLASRGCRDGERPALGGGSGPGAGLCCPGSTGRAALVPDHQALLAAPNSSRRVRCVPQAVPQAECARRQLG